MTEKAVTSVAVPEVEAMAQNLALVRQLGEAERARWPARRSPRDTRRTATWPWPRRWASRRRWRRSSRAGTSRMACGAALHGLDGRVGLDALEDLNLEASLLEVGLDVLQEAAATHGAAAGDDHGAGALEVLDLVASALTKVQVARVGETSHNTPPIPMPPPPRRIRTGDHLPRFRRTRSTAPGRRGIGDSAGFSIAKSTGNIAMFPAREPLRGRSRELPPPPVARPSRLP